MSAIQSFLLDVTFECEFVNFSVNRFLKNFVCRMAV